MAVGDREDGTSYGFFPTPFPSSPVGYPRMSTCTSELPLRLPPPSQATNHLHSKQPVSVPLAPQLSATSPSASTHSSSATAAPATGGHPEFKDEETGVRPAFENEATGGRPEFENEATGGHPEFENEATGGRHAFQDVADGAVATSASHETNELLKMKPALQVIEMGFSSEVVETVIHLKVVETGEDYLTAEALMDAVIAYQVAMTDDDSPGNEEPNSNSRSSQSRQDRQLDNALVYQHDSSASNTTQRGGDGVVRNKKKGKVKSPRNGSKIAATGNQKQINYKSSDLSTDGENVEGNSSALDPSQRLSPFYLKEENKKMKSSRLCKICLENEIRIVFLPCGHLVCCSECSSLVQHCTICRQAVKGCVKVFLA